MDNKYSGVKTLRAIEISCNEFNENFITKIKPLVKGNILEIGSGLGTFCSIIAEIENTNVLGLELDDNLVKISQLNNKKKNLKFLQGDINDPKTIKHIVEFNPDLIIMINVLEHIKDDSEVLKNLYSLMSNEGRLVIYVPAIKFLYSSLDENFHHYRRYSKQELNLKLNEAGFQKIHLRWYNFIGIFGWLLFGKILKHKQLKNSNLSIFEKLIQKIERLELLFTRFVGLSLVGIVKI